jgi:hypothetical protein
MDPVLERRMSLSKALVEALAGGDVDGVRLLYSGPADINDPFAGHQVDGAFERMVREWGPARVADVKSVEVTHAMTAGRYSGTELTMHLQRNGEPLDFPIVVISEHGDDGAIEKSRIYYRRRVLDEQNHFRDRILDEHDGEFEFHPTIAAYQDALRDGSAEGMLETFTEDAYFDGHGQSLILADGLGMGFYDGKPAIRNAIEQMFDILGEVDPEGGAELEHVNVFFDGTTTCLEFNMIHKNHPTNRVHAGVAFYELGPDGLLKAARVYDEHW